MRRADTIHRAFLAALLLFLAFGVACGALVVWGFYFEKPYLEYRNLPFPPTLQRVRPGQIIPLTVVRCSSADDVRSYTVTHELRNEVPGKPTVIMPAELVAITPGCHRSTSLINLVPLGTPGGAYRVHGIAIVSGALRSISVPWTSQPFEVIEE